MAWIETHEEMWEHHKVIRLCTALKQPDYAVVGRLVSLWHFVLRNAWRDANLEAWGDDGIERAARWDGEKGVFVGALRECGFLDGYVVHGWQKRAGRLVQDRRRNEVRKRRRLTGGNTAVKRRNLGGKPSATVPNRTVPNQTIPNPTEEEKRTAAVAAFVPEDLKANLPEIVDWLEYKRQRGQTYKTKGLEALWRAFRDIPPDKRRETVDHSMANNWSGLFQKSRGENGQRKGHSGDDARGVREIGGDPGKFVGISEVIEVPE